MTTDIAGGGDDPWYDVVSGDDLEQGDLLLGCPRATIDWTDPAKPKVLVTPVPALVLTQTCDLVKVAEHKKPKVDEVLLCLVGDDKKFTADGQLKLAAQGRMERYAVLRRHAEHPQLETRVVDFNRVFSVPIARLREYAATSGERLRLRSPYREHVAQAFARFVMRVALKTQPLD